MPNSEDLANLHSEIALGGVDASNHPPLRAATVAPGSASLGNGADFATRSAPPAAVIGINYADNSLGLMGGRDLVFKQIVGVYGQGPNQGVFGHGLGDNATGVYGLSAGKGIGVRGESKEGVAIQAQCFGSGRAARFIGQVDVEGDLVVGGDVKLLGADCAENFDLAVGATALPGTVMVIDDDGNVRPSGQAYDGRVAGVVSGAGHYRPGVILHQRNDDMPCAPLALIGKVFCFVDADHGAVRVGDMLTTSPTPGHAMKAQEPSKAFGAVLGKALGAIESGRGLVPILVALQ